MTEADPYCNFETAAASPYPELPPKKEFKPKFDLPPINDYNSTADPQFFGKHFHLI
jgi:hypothetical protein